VSAVARSDRDGVAELVLDRPDARNALTTELLIELRDHLQQITDTPSVRAVVLAGAGKAFCAGADVREFAPDAPPNASLRRLRLVAEVLTRLENLEQPTFSAVHGAVVGAGWGLALACDVCVAAEDAQFSLPELAKGYRLPPAIPRRLARAVGPGRAAEIVLTGLPQSAEVGHAQGWVTTTASDREAAVEHARRVATTAAGHPRAAVAAAIAAIRGGTAGFVWQEE
jgi:2-(1,2-epoxy-1,2-dihydrophenyl)acetyl-CoA isomerase